MLTDLRDFLRKLDEWHCPSIGEIPFRAIYIEEVWAFDDFDTILPLVTVILLLIVLSCRAVYGDWGIAWNVGCFFATLATIVLMNKTKE